MNDVAAVSNDVTPRVTPTVSMPVRTDWISWVEQFLAHEEPMIQFAANKGLNLIEGAIPGGIVIKMFVGEQVVDQLIDQGIKVLDGVLEKMPTPSVDPVAHPVYAYVLNMINNSAPKFAASMGPLLDDLLKAGMTKAGLAA